MVLVYQKTPVKTNRLQADLWQRPKDISGATKKAREKPGLFK
jgi:hypothetical protein